MRFGRGLAALFEFDGGFQRLAVAKHGDVDDLADLAGSQRVTDPTPEEGLSAIRGFGAYCATVEIHPKEGFIVRQYDINQNPNAVGRTTKRWYTFQGTNRMSLRVDSSELNLPVVENTLIWERVAK